MDKKRALSSRWETPFDLDAARVFVAVAELASFRGAASALRLPRSTVSRRIAELEDALDTRLLQRTTRQVTLTDVGEAFLREVRPGLAMISDAGRTVAETRAEPQGLLRVTASVSMSEIIGGLLLDLVDRYPAIRLELEFTDRTVDLVGEGFDVAVRPGTLADSTLVARALGASQSGYFASASYVKRHGAPKRPRDLVEDDHACIVFASTSRGNRWLFGRGAKREEVAVPRTHVMNSLALVRLAVQRGLGIGWIPGAQAHVSSGALVPILERYWPPPMPVSLVYPSSRHLAPQVRVAIDHLAANLRFATVPR